AGAACITNASAFDPTKLSQAPSVPTPPPSPEIKRVLIVFKCHFDAGFIDTQANVVHRYFNEFFPKAIETAEQLDRTKGPDRANYTWTTGSWLLYEYLEQAAPDPTESPYSAQQPLAPGPRPPLRISGKSRARRSQKDGAGHPLWLHRLA